jgi:hypothetical protein
MTENVKEEVSVAPSVQELSLRQGTQRNAAEHKGPGVERDFLLALLALFSNHQDGVDLLCPSWCDPDVRQD